MMNIMGLVIWFAAALSPEQQSEINALDAQIQSSMAEKNRHESLATRYADTAYRLQTNQKVQDAKRFYDMEAQERIIAKHLQAEIDALEKSKSEILNGISPSQ